MPPWGTSRLIWEMLVREDEPWLKRNRREVLQKIVYVTPVILTLPVLPSFASAGSGNDDDKNRQKDKDKDK